MQQQVSLKLLPSEAADEKTVLQYICATTGKTAETVTGYQLLKKSIDARSRQVWINLTVNAFIGEPFHKKKLSPVHFKDVATANKQVIIIGAGPCGLFAALKLIELGIRPVLLERGKDVRARRRDLARMNREGLVNPDSNYCFGEGGAGTYSDGKLYTRSTKRGDVNRVLELLVQFGASENILYEAHPHIGTNKLPLIIEAIRKRINECGGIFLFEKKVTGFSVNNERVAAVATSDGGHFNGDAVILATGHSARDIFLLLHHHHIAIEAKPFALGVRVEHPQSLIDSIQYHCLPRDPFLPPASYGLVNQADGRGVFSFCMCPGGIIAPAATAPGEVVVNGWSPSKRNNPFANSGIVVEVKSSDINDFHRYITNEPQRQLLQGPLAMMAVQQAVEQQAFAAGGGRLAAPAQRMDDFVHNRCSTNLPDCSYLPGIHSVNLGGVLPGFVRETLRQGFIAFGKKMRGYYTNEAVVVATESRTSSPVRIPRNEQLLHHPQVKNLYPAGEGAGYAGGIISAAMDGEKVAAAVALALGK